MISYAALLMFNTSNMDIVKSCQLHFKFDMQSTLWAKCARTFDIKFFSASDNMFCKAILHQVMRTLYEHFTY